jgi:lipopolysaccharide assembly outer membrane protein LptD (OstA)
MTIRRAIFIFLLWTMALAGRVMAQEKPAWEIEPLSGDEGGVWHDFRTGLTTATNGVIVRYSGAVLTANQVTVNEESGDVVADGDVRIQQGEQLWVSEHVRYNFKTRMMEAQQFRTGQAPIFVAGTGLHGEQTNHIYTATNSFLTPDDVSNPAIKVRAKHLKIIEGDRVEARHAVLYVAGVPAFYFPYYTRSLSAHGNNFSFVPGYRTSYGPFLLGSYHWFLNEQLDGVMHFDYRERRGPGVGPDVNYHFGRWGDGTVRYYYTHDDEPDASVSGSKVPADRQRVNLSYQSNPFTNLYVKSVLQYQTDTNVVRDFFEGEYRQNPQPGTFLDVNRFWRNFSLDVYYQPRLNDFLETVERLPEVRLTGYRQQIGDTPLYYETESSAGYYQRLFAQTNGMHTGMDYAASRADSLHQIFLPETFFGWLNVTPRAGGRITYYSTASGDGATTDERYRGVFNTGAEATATASRTWAGMENKFFQVDGIRHIVQPSVNYAYVPSPNYSGTNQIPQFDHELASLRLLPIDFPDYNSIDSIDSENVVRFGLHNKLQTKRKGEVVNLVDWNIYSDWRLTPAQGQTTFSDLYNDIVVRPRWWLTLESLTRYDIDDGFCRMSLTTATIKPNNVWSWSVSHFYLRDDFSSSPTALGEGNNQFGSTLYYRLNENWGFRTHHRFDARSGILQEQSYSFYRDLRCWTGALTLRVVDNPTGPTDYTVAFTFSLKAFPRYGMGSDTTRPFWLLGG